jgi:hypothetical protein
MIGPEEVRPGDYILEMLRDARRRRDQADRQIRLLLAFAREHSRPRPYRLADLAEATGMSISGVRTAYTAADIEQVNAVIAATYRDGLNGHGHPAA